MFLILRLRLNQQDNNVIRDTLPNTTIRKCATANRWTTRLHTELWMIEPVPRTEIRNGNDVRGFCCRLIRTEYNLETRECSRGKPNRCGGLGTMAEVSARVRVGGDRTGRPGIPGGEEDEKKGLQSACEVAMALTILQPSSALAVQ